MAATPCNAGNRITATFNSVAINSCLGGSVRFTVEFDKFYPDQRLSPVKLCAGVDGEGTVEAAELVSMIAKGTNGSLVFSTLQGDGGSNTVTAVTMEMAGTEIDFNSKPFRQRHSFQYNPGNTENVAPLTVA